MYNTSPQSPRLIQLVVTMASKYSDIVVEVKDGMGIIKVHFVNRVYDGIANTDAVQSAQCAQLLWLAIFITLHSGSAECELVKAS